MPAAPRIYTSKAKNAQEAHEAMRPTSFARTPEEVARYLDGDAARLYELIWKRAVASQMECAEQERTTVDVISADKKITLRATGTVTLFDGFLTLYQEGQDDDADEDGAKLPKVAAGDAAKVEKVTPGAAFHRAAAALFRSQPGAQAGRAGHRPAFDLCHHPLHPARPRLCAHGPRALLFPKTRAGWSPPSCRASSSAMWNMISPPIWKRSWTKFPPASWTGRQLLRDFWKDFSAAVGETKDLQDPRR